MKSAKIHEGVVPIYESGNYASDEAMEETGYFGRVYLSNRFKRVNPKDLW